MRAALLGIVPCLLCVVQCAPREGISQRGTALLAAQNGPGVVGMVRTVNPLAGGKLKSLNFTEGAVFADAQLAGTTGKENGFGPTGRFDIQVVRGSSLVVALRSYEVASHDVFGDTIVERRLVLEFIPVSHNPEYLAGGADFRVHAIMAEWFEEPPEHKWISASPMVGHLVGTRPFVVLEFKGFLQRSSFGSHGLFVQGTIQLRTPVVRGWLAKHNALRRSLTALAAKGAATPLAASASR